MQTFWRLTVGLSILTAATFSWAMDGEGPGNSGAPFNIEDLIIEPEKSNENPQKAEGHFIDSILDCSQKLSEKLTGFLNKMSFEITEVSEADVNSFTKEYYIKGTKLIGGDVASGHALLSIQRVANSFLGTDALNFSVDMEEVEDTPSATVQKGTALSHETRRQASIILGGIHEVAKQINTNMNHFVDSISITHGENLEIILKGNGRATSESAQSNFQMTITKRPLRPIAGICEYSVFIVYADRTSPLLSAEMEKGSAFKKELKDPITQEEFENLKIEKRQEIWDAEDYVTRYGYMRGIISALFQSRINIAWTEFYATYKDPSGKSWSLGEGQQYDLDGNPTNV